jgi:5-hydroxyisourate hydrolase
MSTLSTHVLDTALGGPAQGIRVTLARGSTELGSAITDADGRAKDVHGKQPLTEGDYRLSFDVGAYFSARKRESFYNVITVEFRVGPGAQHYHVPLLLSPYGYSTYRGS